MLQMIYFYLSKKWIIQDDKSSRKRQHSPTPPHSKSMEIKRFNSDRWVKRLNNSSLLQLWFRDYVHLILPSSISLFSFFFVSIQHHNSYHLYKEAKRGFKNSKKNKLLNSENNLDYKWLTYLIADWNIARDTDRQRTLCRSRRRGRVWMSSSNAPSASLSSTSSRSPMKKWVIYSVI